MITIFKLRRALDNDDNLRKLRDNYYNILSDYEKYELNTYLKYNNLKYYKKDFIRSFCNKLKHYPVIKQEEIINLISKKLNLEPDSPLQVSMFDYMQNLTITDFKPEGRSHDAYFNDLVEHENYEELHKYYGIREIERDSNLLEDRSK